MQPSQTELLGSHPKQANAFVLSRASFLERQLIQQSSQAFQAFNLHCIGAMWSKLLMDAFVWTLEHNNWCSRLNIMLCTLLYIYCSTLYSIFIQQIALHIATYCSSVCTLLYIYCSTLCSIIALDISLHSALLLFERRHCMTQLQSSAQAH